MRKLLGAVAVLALAVTPAIAERNIALYRGAEVVADEVLIGVDEAVHPAQIAEILGGEGLELARQNMDRLADLLRARGIALTVAVYPWPDQVRHHDLRSKQAAFWSAWAAAQGAGFIDYFPRFIGATPPDEVLDRYFIRGDVHWNEAGHEVVAQGFLEYYGARQPWPAAAAPASAPSSSPPSPPPPPPARSPGPVGP